jgi:hypothetical protein
MTDEEKQLKARELGEAMRAACPLCAEGVPVAHVTTFGGQDAGERTMHREAESGGKLGRLSPCRASDLYEQFLELLQQPVAS